MDKKVEILLNSMQNIDSVDVVTYEKVPLENKRSNILEYQVRNVLSATETFQAERQANADYRIYGRIEYMSLLNGLKITAGGVFNEFEDFFNPQDTGNSKSILNSFQFYLVRPADDGYGDIINSDTEYVKYFQVMATPNEFELYPAGYSNNVYGEQTYAFSFNVDFDVTNLRDNFGFPLTELFLYAQYIPRTIAPPETIYRTRWTTSGVQSVTSFTPKSFNIDDFIETSTGVNIGELIDYVDTQYYQEVQVPQTFYIRTPYSDGSPKYLQWKYNPFISFRLQYLSDEVYQAKLSEITPSTTTLKVFYNPNPTVELNVRKYLPQVITETQNPIINWSGTTNSFYSWNQDTGVLTFTGPGTYTIRFETQINITEGTNKYIAQTVIQEKTGLSWEDIPETDTTYQTTNESRITITGRTYGLGDQLRITVQLILNPALTSITTEIPYYAIIIEDSGNFVWRNISEQGYVDPLTGVGVDYPFINKKRYLFSTIALDVVPDLTETTYTLPAFQEVWFSDDAETLDITPTNDLDDIGKPCQ